MSQKFNVKVFVGNVEITDENRHKYIIKNKTIDRIVNAVVDRSIVAEKIDSSKQKFVLYYWNYL